jgi:hypothetical protein
LLVVFDVRLFLSGLAGLGWASVCLSSSSFLPSFLPSKFLNIIPLPSSSAFFVRAVRHQLALKVVVKKP